MQLLKKILRPYLYIVRILLGFGYDFHRCLKYGGWKMNYKNRDVRNYKAVKIYHRLEKSMCFRDRKVDSGWSAVYELIDLIKVAQLQEDLGFQDKIAISVLKKFVDSSQDSHIVTDPKKLQAIKFVSKLDVSGYAHMGGYTILNKEFLSSGKLENPEIFFNSRFSIRDFSDSKVPAEVIERAVNLALKTPSVCSRQAWHVYHLESKELIDKALSFQNGNRGFGYQIKTLLIISSDLRAFDTAGERYQQWIDGGMFGMSLVMAFHSLGIGTCCLNWSRTGKEDLMLRMAMPIHGSHTIIMMLAVGYPRDQIKACVSQRRPLDEIYTYLS